MEDEKRRKANEFKKRLYTFVLRLIKFLDKLDKDLVSRKIADQLFRSGSSILANYVEGQGASSRKDFANFLNHSLKSANESKMWLALLRDSRRAKSDDVEWFLGELVEISKIFASSLLTLRGKGKTS